jgi:sucrose-6-phosphate hydrolase SacC (GH32 family)
LPINYERIIISAQTLDPLHPANWMDENPNGLVYDEYEEQYHLYYQYNPNDAVWRQPLYCGHATSEDLLEWYHHDPAIGPEHDYKGIFSCSIAVDFENTSGLFDDSIPPEQGVVAIYTD